MSASVAKARARPDALLHAARKFARVFIRPLVERHELQLLVDDALPLGGGDAAQFEPEADILPHRAPGQQGELLEHHGDAARAHEAQRRPVAARDIDLLILVAHQHAAARHLC